MICSRNARRNHTQVHTSKGVDRLTDHWDRRRADASKHLAADICRSTAAHREGRKSVPVDASTADRTETGELGLLRQLDPFIGDRTLQQVHVGTLHPVHRQAPEGQGEDTDERAPKIKLIPIGDKRPTYPLSREDHAVFFSGAARLSRTHVLGERWRKAIRRRPWLVNLICTVVANTRTSRRCLRAATSSHGGSQALTSREVRR